MIGLNRYGTKTFRLSDVTMQMIAALVDSTGLTYEQVFVAMAKVLRDDSAVQELIRARATVMNLGLKQDCASE